MYREQKRRPKVARVEWGPFPIRPVRLALAAFSILIGALFAWMGLQGQTLVCERGRDPICRTEGFLLADEELAGRTLEAVEIQTVRRGKGRGAEYGTVILKSDRGRLALLEVEGDVARAVAARLDAFRTSNEVQIREELRGEPLVLVISLIAVSVALSLTRSGFAGVGRMELVVREGWLDARRRVLGLSGRTGSVSLAHTEDVIVEWTDEKDFWLSRGQRPRKLGRLALVRTGGGRTPVTDAFWPGETLHLRAATALRALLDLAPMRGGVEEQLAAIERNPERPQWAKLLPTRIALCWLGACCGSLVGIALFGTLGALLGAFRSNESIPEWVIGGGGAVGALAGIVFVLWLARPRVPR